MNDYERLLKRKLQDPEFKALWDASEAEYTMISALIKARNEAGLTQQQLSTEVGFSQSILSRIENGKANPSLKTLDRLAKGMGKKLVIGFM